MGRESRRKWEVLDRKRKQGELGGSPWEEKIGFSMGRENKGKWVIPHGKRKQGKMGGFLREEKIVGNGWFLIGRENRGK